MKKLLKKFNVGSTSLILGSAIFILFMLIASFYMLELFNQKYFAAKTKIVNDVVADGVATYRDVYPDEDNYSTITTKGDMLAKLNSNQNMNFLVENVVKDAIMYEGKAKVNLVGTTKGRFIKKGFNNSKYEYEMHTHSTTRINNWAFRMISWALEASADYKNSGDYEFGNTPADRLAVYSNSPRDEYQNDKGDHISRTDCSGMISMMYNYVGSPIGLQTTGSLPAYFDQLADDAELKRGDLLIAPPGVFEGTEMGHAVCYIGKIDGKDKIIQMGGLEGAGINIQDLSFVLYDQTPYKKYRIKDSFAPTGVRLKHLGDDKNRTIRDDDNITREQINAIYSKINAYCQNANSFEIRDIAMAIICTARNKILNSGKSFDINTLIAQLNTLPRPSIELDLSESEKEKSILVMNYCWAAMSTYPCPAITPNSNLTKENLSTFDTFVEGGTKGKKVVGKYYIYKS